MSFYLGFTLAAALGTGLISLKRGRLEQDLADERITGAEYAKQEAEVMGGLSHQLFRCQRIYEHGVRNAANHMLTEEQYDGEFRETYIDFRTALDRAKVYLSDFGEQTLGDLAESCIEADFYMRAKAREKGGGQVREGDSLELLEEDQTSLNWNDWQVKYNLALEKMKDTTANKLRLLSAYHPTENR